MDRKSNSTKVKTYFLFFKTDITRHETLVLSELDNGKVFLVLGTWYLKLGTRTWFWVLGSGYLVLSPGNGYILLDIWYWELGTG